MVSMPPAQVPEFADTEVSTNVSVVVSDDFSSAIELRFALYGGCVSNCLQVAFGRDADGDGVLGVDESETLFGWRNGRYFAEDMPGGRRIEEEAAYGATSRVFTVRLELSKGRGLKDFSAMDESGAPVLTNLSSSAHGWLYRPEWNMMRVTRRGPGVPDEWFICHIHPHSFIFEMK